MTPPPLVAAGWVVVWAALVLGIHGDIPAEEVSEMQNKAIQQVVEKFHIQRDLPNGYTVTSIVKAAEEAYQAGLFVNVEFLLKQTSCSKQERSNANCQAVQNGKTFHCFGCFKFEYENDSVISRAEECILQRHVSKKRKARWSDLCKDVAKKTPGTTNVGKYSFLKSQ